MANYYKYTSNVGYGSISSSNVFGSQQGQCYVCPLPDSSCKFGTCKSVCGVIGNGLGTSYNQSQGMTLYCNVKPTYYQIIERYTYNGEYIVNLSNVCGLGNTVQNESSWNSCILPSAITDSKAPVQTEQTNNIGSAFVQGGSGLLHIGIQLIPYAICFTVIMILFALFKNWGKLKTNRQLNRIKRQKIRRERAEIKKYGNK